ncbi:pirin family protein [Jatrophihabitans sp.]|uniref:pirin family protein n=1 Tax=Jatrophihabitans sp. TaxID=1932789 RepID=UPI0030C68C55|nr:hypothetical protein [Jatrophihabitans sp.]
MRLLRAADRYVVDQPGIRSWHCFSAGAHYDPANLSFGPLLGVDEHLVDPGAGFEDHAHRGVDIVSVVLAGALSHRSGSVERVVRAGETLLQRTGDGIRHTERNASATEPLRLLQLTSLPESTVVSVVSGGHRFHDPWLHLFVAAGEWRVGDVALHPGDSLRAEEPVGVVAEVVVAGSLVVAAAS